MDMFSIGSGRTNINHRILKECSYKIILDNIHRFPAAIDQSPGAATHGMILEHTVSVFSRFSLQTKAYCSFCRISRGHILVTGYSIIKAEGFPAHDTGM